MTGERHGLDSPRRHRIDRCDHGADDVQGGVVIPGVGHFLAEEAPEELLAELTEFLAAFRDGSAAYPGRILPLFTFG